MFITDRFVAIHLPKTGGTFVTAVLSQLYVDRVPWAPADMTVWRAMVNRFRSAAGSRYCEIRKHGTCRDIPRRFRRLPIVAVVRFPHDHVVSTYRFGLWKGHPEWFGDGDQLRRRCPSFPELTFPEYLDLYKTRTWRVPGEFVGSASLPGPITRNFIRFYSRDPKAAFREYALNGIDARDRDAFFYPVHFLHTHSLNQDLHDFLLTAGHSAKELEFILDLRRILPPKGGRAEGDDWRSYYTPETLRQVREAEDLMFRLFPEFEDMLAEAT